MKYIYAIVVFSHALIHILGFVKGFGLKDIKELTLPISRPVSLLWLTLVLLITIYGILFLTNNKYSWLLGFMSVLFSQILIILFWKDAKFGTLPNIVILLVSMVSLGSYRFQDMVMKETNHILNQSEVCNKKDISESDIINLPNPVKNWLRNSGVIGKPFIYMGKVTQSAEMKMKPNQKNWIRATAVQYTTIETPAFIWVVDVSMNSVLNFVGRDKFQKGKGEMLIKIYSLIDVVKERGEKLDEGTIQRYLGEMVWFPSLAVSRYITWEQIDDTTAKATMDYMGTKGSGTFYFNSRGDVTKFVAMRYMGNDSTSKKYEWVLLVEDYETFAGIKVPSKMTATWKLGEGDWTWLKLEITDIKYNENIEHEKLLKR